MFANYPAMMDQEALLNHVTGQMASSHLHSRRQSNNSASRASSQARRSIRIEKPRSSHSSPRRMERRKTTSAVRQFAIPDEQLAAWANEGYHHPVGESWQQPKQTSRPMSWHPGSTQVFTPPAAMLVPQSTYASPVFPNMSPARQMNQMEYQNYSAIPTYSQAQPISHSALVEPQLDFNNYQAYRQQMMAALQAAASTTPPGSDAMLHSTYQQPQEQQQQQQPILEFRQDFMPTPQPQVQVQQTTYPTSAPSSIQDIPAATMEDNNNNNNHVLEHSTTSSMDADGEAEDDTEELVGMGLYDLPDTTSWLLTGQSTGKGLKLEEAWQPPTPSPEDDDAEDEDEDEEEPEPEPEAEADVSSAEESDGEPPVAVAAGWPLQTQIAHHHHPYHQQQPVVNSADLSGQSFFFEEDENAAKDWWYAGEQPKQPVPQVVAQQTGFGYGWIYSS